VRIPCFFNERGPARCERLLVGLSLVQALFFFWPSCFFCDLDIGLIVFSPGGFWFQEPAGFGVFDWFPVLDGGGPPAIKAALSGFMVKGERLWFLLILPRSSKTYFHIFRKKKLQARDMELASNLISLSSRVSLTSSFFCPRVQNYDLTRLPTTWSPNISLEGHHSVYWITEYHTGHSYPSPPSGAKNLEWILARNWSWKYQTPIAKS